MDQLLNHVIELAKQAGSAINQFYQAATPAIIATKSDDSPLTQADLAANHIITQGLRALTPVWPVLSEEEALVPFNTRKQWQQYWLIDPLDGTKEFLEKNNEFTVNVALIQNNYPILGVVYAPASTACYFAMQGHGAFKQMNNATPQRIHTRQWQQSQTIIAVSRHHGQDTLQPFLQQFKQPQLLSCGSALKFGLVAEGKADIYPRLSPTSEWDTAAGQCILEQAGGAVILNNGARLCYNKKESLINPHFLAVGDSNHHWTNSFKE